MDQEERQATHDEIVSAALLKLEPPATSISSLAALPDPFGRAKELFVNVFVAQALDQIESLLGDSKEVIAERAAEYARMGVDLAVVQIENLKATLGLGPPVAGGPLLPN